MLSLILTMALCGCGMATGDGGQTSDGGRIDTGFIVYGPDSYDSADTSVLVAKDEEAGTMTFLNLTLGREYTLAYDGTTCLYDKYGKILSLSQIGVGEIVDIKFVKSKKHLTTMSIAAGAWTINSTNRYVINSIRKNVTIGEDIYNISSEVGYFSNDKKIELQDLIATDTLTFRGIGTSVYSVVVDNGHGYLRITGHQNFVGGWIEVGHSIIERVTDDMILTVPEGSYQVKISYGGTTSEKKVTIFRNSESKLDYSDVVFEAPKVGTVLFSLTPSNAELYIDGEKADVSAAIELTYGLHQLICRADGYTSVTQYLNVGQPTAGIDITLEKKDDKSDDSDKDSDDNNSSGSTGAGSDSNSGSGTGTDGGNSAGGGSDSGTGSSTGNGNDAGDGTGSGDGPGNGNGDGAGTAPGSDTIETTYYRVHIDSPENVEVYLDGSYVGVSPCSFKKTEGSHIITLSREGYVTRSYTIFVDSDDKDISFSFVALSQSE